MANQPFLQSLGFVSDGGRIHISDCVQTVFVCERKNIVARALHENCYGWIVLKVLSERAGNKSAQPPALLATDSSFPSTWISFACSDMASRVR